MLSGCDIQPCPVPPQPHDQWTSTLMTPALDPIMSVFIFYNRRIAVLQTPGSIVSLSASATRNAHWSGTSRYSSQKGEKQRVFRIEMQSVSAG